AGLLTRDRRLDEERALRDKACACAACGRDEAVPLVFRRQTVESGAGMNAARLLARQRQRERAIRSARHSGRERGEQIAVAIAYLRLDERAGDVHWSGHAGFGHRGSKRPATRFALLGTQRAPGRFEAVEPRHASPLEFALVPLIR